MKASTIAIIFVSLVAAALGIYIYSRRKAATGAAPAGNVPGAAPTVTVPGNTGIVGPASPALSPVVGTVPTIPKPAAGPVFTPAAGGGPITTVLMTPAGSGIAGSATAAWANSGILGQAAPFNPITPVTVVSADRQIINPDGSWFDINNRLLGEKRISPMFDLGNLFN